jgi:hypothetical protein
LSPFVLGCWRSIRLQNGLFLSCSQQCVCPSSLPHMLHAPPISTYYTAIIGQDTNYENNRCGCATLAMYILPLLENWDERLKQPRGTRKYVCVTFVSALSCIGRVLANGRFLTQEDLPNACKQNSSNRNNETRRPHRPGNATDIQSKCAAFSLCNFLNHSQLFFLLIRPKYSPHNFLLKHPTVYLLPLQRETTFHAHIKEVNL